jgi:putative hydrolase of the HAD superfamily
VAVDTWGIQTWFVDGIEVVVFDWYATLGAPNDEDFWPRVPELIEAAGGVVDRDALREWEREHPSLHEEQSSSEAIYRQWQRDRLEHLFVRCGIDAAARVELLDHVDDQRYTRAFAVFDGVPAVLRELRDRGLGLGICSNWDWGLDRHLRANGIAELLDFVVCSAEVGRRKPHPTMFDLVLHHAGAPADRVLFVGDNWVEDVGGASDAGMRTVHVATAAACAAPDDHGPVPCITDLAELLALVDPPGR